MNEQSPPLRLHRCQRPANDIGVVPLHEPVDAVSVCPSTGVPEIVGVAVFTGGVAVTAAPLLPTSSASAATAALVTSSLLPLTVWSFPPRRAPSHFCCKGFVKAFGRKAQPTLCGRCLFLLEWVPGSRFPGSEREETERRTSTSPRRPRRGRGHRRSV